MKEFKICSLCLGETECLDIFSMENNVDDDIFTITGVQIKQDGEYPTGACTDCMDTLEQCMDFRRQVQKSFESITAGSSFTSTVDKPKSGKKKTSGTAPAKRTVPPIEDFSKGLYKCHKCLKGFATKKDITFHVTKGTCTFHCPECPLIFGKKPFFDYHMKAEHSPPVETGSVKKSTEEKDVVFVGQSEAGPAPDIEVVKVEMMDYSDAPAQIEIEVVPPVFKCVQCNVNFGTETSLTAHKIRKHNQKIEMFPCELCTPVISFISKKALAAHTELLHPEPVNAVWEILEEPAEDADLMEIYKNL